MIDWEKNCKKIKRSINRYKKSRCALITSAVTLCNGVLTYVRFGTTDGQLDNQPRGVGRLKRLWKVSLGRNSEFEADAFEKNFLTIGFGLMEDISHANDRNALAAVLQEVYPDAKPKQPVEKGAYGRISSVSEP